MKLHSIGENQSEITDMEAGNKIKIKKKKKSSKRMKEDNESNISFVVERPLNRSNGSIFGDSVGSGQSSNSKKVIRDTPRSGMFTLGLSMIICCVSSQIMVEDDGS